MLLRKATITLNSEFGVLRSQEKVRTWYIDTVYHDADILQARPDLTYYTIIPKKKEYP